MGPIEVVYMSIGAVILLIAIARGYVKELGATLIILTGIFILTFPEKQITSLIDHIAGAMYGNHTQAQLNRILATTYSLLFIAIVYAGYAGKTLEFNGKSAKQPGGFLISLLVGLVNGYLIAGTLWYYQQANGYPWYQPFIPDFTKTAQHMIDVLPPTLFDNPVWWIVPVAILLLVRVRN
jgi:hypothetical protein